jgi:heme-degrading monooxygenase HmoA
MFARVSRFTASVGQLEEGLALAREAVARRVEKQPGFEGLMVMMDRETGFAFTITFWKTEEDLAGSRELGEREAETAARMFDVGVEVSNCEVVFSTFPTFAA